MIAVFDSIIAVYKRIEVGTISEVSTHGYRLPDFASAWLN
jgi:hypothetical protein